MDSEIKEIAQQRKKFIGSLTSNHLFIYLSIYMFLINWKHLGILIFGEETVKDRIEKFSSRYDGEKFFFWEHSFWENGWAVLLLCIVLAALSWLLLPYVNFEIKKYTGKHERKLIVENDQKTAIEKWRVENPKEVALAIDAYENRLEDCQKCIKELRNEIEENEIGYKKKIEENEKAYENKMIVFEDKIMTLRESERKFRALLAETISFIETNAGSPTVRSFGEVVVEVAEIDPIDAYLPADRPKSSGKKFTIGEKGFANLRDREEQKSLRK